MAGIGIMHLECARQYCSLQGIELEEAVPICKHWRLKGHCIYQVTLNPSACCRLCTYDEFSNTREVPWQAYQEPESLPVLRYRTSAGTDTLLMPKGVASPLQHNAAHQRKTGPQHGGLTMRRCRGSNRPY